MSLKTNVTVPDGSVAMRAFWRSLAGSERTTIRTVASRRAVVVRPGEGHRVGNVEFLARSIDTPRFNLGMIAMQPARSGPPTHEHADEDDAFYVLEGEMTFLLEDEEILAGSGTFVLVPPGVQHTFANRSDAVARMLNIHAPAGFDLRLESD
jgi:mannose-6-phosphate isomerase-like protein (cupin superfamily)